MQALALLLSQFIKIVFLHGTTHESYISYPGQTTAEEGIELSIFPPFHAPEDTLENFCF